MNQERIQDNQKVIIVGDTSVGKTCILNNYFEKEFKIKPNITVGADFHTKQILIKKNQFENIPLQNDTSAKLVFWDIAGQMKYREIARTFFKGAKGVLFVYDVLNEDSMNKLDQWVKEVSEVIEQPQSKSYVSFLVANKCDLDGAGRVPSEKGRQKMEQHGIQEYFECSAKTGQGVEQMMNQLGAMMIQMYSQNQQQNQQQVFIPDNFYLGQSNRTNDHKEEHSKCCS